MWKWEALPAHPPDVFASDAQPRLHSCLRLPSSPDYEYSFICRYLSELINAVGIPWS